LGSLGLLVDFLVAGLGVVFFYGWLTHRREPLNGDNADHLVPVDATRRTFLQLAAGAALAFGFGALSRRRI
jgi:hypothetical protein